MNLCLSRRTALVGLLASVPMTSRAALAADPFAAAIRRARAADAAYRESGRLALAIQATGQTLPFGWRAHRIALLRACTLR